MTDEQEDRARLVAETVLEDRDDERSFTTATALGYFLLGHYAPGTAAMDVAEPLAAKILEHLDGGELLDPESLAAHLVAEVQPALTDLDDWD